MENKPDFIDNLDGNSMANALKSVVENLSTKRGSIIDIEDKVDEIIIQIYFLRRIIYFGNISNRL